MAGGFLLATQKNSTLSRGNLRHVRKSHGTQCDLDEVRIETREEQNVLDSEEFSIVEDDEQEDFLRRMQVQRVSIHKIRSRPQILRKLKLKTI